MLNRGNRQRWMEYGQLYRPPLIAAFILIQCHQAVAAAGNFARLQSHVYRASTPSQSKVGANSGLSIRSIPATSTTSAKIILAWNATANATSYNVYRATSAGAEGSTPLATGITSTTYTDTGLASGTTYYYQVTAVNTYGESPKSNEAYATTLPAVPAAPTGLAAVSGDTKATLTWTASTGATSYNVYMGTTAGGESATALATGITGTSYTATGLTNGKASYFTVKAVNLGGTSGASNEASTTPEPAITYAAGLQFISTPLDYSSTDLDTLFGYTGVKLAVWQPASFSYALTPTVPADRLRLGIGYWVRLKSAVTLNGTGTVADTTQNYSIPLTAGWNSIGDPFFSTIPVSSLLVDGTAFSQAASGSNPSVSSTLWAYSGSTNGYIAAQSLAPETGYWIYAYRDCTLQVPHPN